MKQSAMQEERTEPAYVRVEQIDGKYWFVKGGEKFLALGVNCVLPADMSKPKDGRRYNVWEQYNNNVQEWMAAACGNLRAWNFNTVAGWSHEYLYEHSGMYHTRVLWLGPWGDSGKDDRLVDVFSEAYEQAVDKEAYKSVRHFATNEYLIGYFANNELPWYGERGWPTSPRISLVSRYMELPENAVGKQRLVAFMKQFYQNDFSVFSRDWSTDAENFDELAACTEIAPAVRSYQRCVAEWAGVVADRYFALVSSAIKRHDPNHLFLGVRIAGQVYRPVFEAYGKYADVISINQYSKSGQLDASYFDAIADVTGKPIMITEFSWRAMENTSGCRNSKGADVTVPAQRDRAKAFRTYARQALELPYLVGYDWFQYADQPPGGRFDGEDSNYGLLDIHNQPYVELLDAITEVNGQAEMIHAASCYVMPENVAGDWQDYREITVTGGGQALPEKAVVADRTSDWVTWGDDSAGAWVDVEERGDGIFVLKGDPKGWGCGVTFMPADALSLNPGGSARLSGGQEISLLLKTGAAVLVAPGITESGAGPVNAQTFSGEQGADGEAYTQLSRELHPGESRYVFSLLNMEPSTGYGNQRGNKRIDLQALESVQLFFPSGQGPFEIELAEIAIR